MLIKEKYHCFVKYYVLLIILTYLPFYQISKSLYEASILLLLPAVLNRESLRIFKTKSAIILFSVMGVYALSYLASYLILETEKDLRLFIDTLKIALPLLILVSCTPLLKRKITLQEVIYTIAIGLILSSAIALYKWHLTGFNGRVTVGTNLILVYGAAVACSVIMMLVSLRLNLATTLTSRALLVIASLMGCFGLVAAGAKGAMLALAVAIPASILIFFRDRKSMILMLAGLTSLVLIILSSQSMKDRVINASTQVSSYFSSKDSQTRSSQGMRLEMWRASFIKISEAPLSANGTRYLKDQFKELFDANVVSKHIKRFHHVHNDYLQAWLSRGPIGFISLIAVLLLPIILLSGNRQTMVLGVSFACVMSIASMTNVPLMHSYTLRYFLLITVVMFAVSYIKPNATDQVIKT